MKFNYYIDSKSALDKLRILFKRLDANQLTNNINELYLDSKFLFSFYDNEKIFANIFKIKKNINIIPHSQLLYHNLSEEESNDDERTPQFQQKLDYLDNFYEENEDEGEVYYSLKRESFSKYSYLNDIVLEKINNDPSTSRSSILKFLDIPLQQGINLSRRISPFIFLEDSQQNNILKFDEFFDTYDNIIELFDTILIYTPLSYIKNILSFRNRNKISEFDAIILWFPDFNEIYATQTQIKELKSTLRDFYRLNKNIIYLYSGMMIGKYFSDYITEVICKIDVYPGRKIIPTKKSFGRRKRNIFFPQFGRPTAPETIASPPLRDLFECNCIICSEFHNDDIFDKIACLVELAEKDTSKYYHNYHSFMLKLDNHKNIEDYPNQKLDKFKLETKWRDALDEN